jgi:hypothetical protein
MDRTWFPSSGESGSFLRYDAGSNNNTRERGSSPRDKTWATVIECGLRSKPCRRVYAFEATRHAPSTPPPRGGPRGRWLAFRLVILTAIARFELDPGSRTIV